MIHFYDGYVEGIFGAIDSALDKEGRKSSCEPSVSKLVKIVQKPNIPHGVIIIKSGENFAMIHNIKHEEHQ